MNSKNALFLSAALTAFCLAILFAVVTKLTSISNTPVQAAAAVEVAANVEPTAEPELPTPTEVQPTAAPVAAVLPSTPEEAAFVAAKSINRQDVYSVETFDCNGVSCFKVVFVSGDEVYVGLDHNVLAFTPTVVATVAPSIDTVITYVEPYVAPVKHKSSSSSKPSKPSNGGGGEHEGGEEEGEH